MLVNSTINTVLKTNRAKIFYDTKMQHRCSLVLLGLFTVQLRFRYFRRLALKTITKQSNTTYACMQLCIMDVQFGWKLSSTYFFFIFSDIIKKSVRMSSTYFVDRLIEKFKRTLHLNTHLIGNYTLVYILNYYIFYILIYHSTCSTITLSVDYN